GEIGGRDRGVMVSMESGVSTAYALNNIQERGRLFIGAQEDVYVGMIVGENARPEDLPVNPCKAKHLTNMRSQGEGKGIQLEAPLGMTLERAIEYIDIDEYVEATPKSLRLRKRILDATARKRRWPSSRRNHLAHSYWGNQTIRIKRSTNSDRIAIKLAATGEPCLVRKQIAGQSPPLKKLMRIAPTRLATFRSG